jgi:outer membrane protein assembly factor BamD (BamD/ComL family)
MLYRTIEGSFKTLEKAQNQLSPDSEIVEQDGQFYVVNGLYDKFKDALPKKNLVHNRWNTSWKHVLPVKTTVENARELGFEVPDTLTRQAVNQNKLQTLSIDFETVNSLRNTATTVERLEESKEKPENDLRKDLIQALEPKFNQFVEVAENSPNKSDAEFAQYWIAKTCYLKGLDLSVQRLPKVHNDNERHAWAQEELCYDSAIEAIDTFLERYPYSEKTEEMLYLKAATSYHLTYRGHHFYQVNLAKQAYQVFIDTYPNSDRVPRAKMNLLGIALEIARMDVFNFDEVIRIGEELLTSHPDANDYIRSRAKIIVAEAYFDDRKDFEIVKKLCDEIIEEFSKDTNGAQVLATAFRLKAKAHSNLKEYDEAAASYSIFLDFYTGEKFHFGYEWEEQVAAAYYWRARALLNLKRYTLAITDFQKAVDEFPQTQHGKLAVGDIEYVNSLMEGENE